jgi:hypothetical protein
VNGPPSEEPEPPPGHLRPTSPAAITGWAVAGLIGGWLVHPVAERVSGSAPVLTWAQPLALALVAAILGSTAWLTWRTLHVHRQRLEPHRAVNRLVLARASALVGALVAGGYLGYAVSWLGDDAELASQRAWRSGACSVAGLAIVITAVLLERACRVRSDDTEP